MPKFRKRPVVIEAVQFDGSEAGATQILEWMAASGASYRPGVNQIFIPTLEGLMAASRGDWVIRGVAGEHYPCRSDIFEQTYEPVE